MNEGAGSNMLIINDFPPSDNDGVFFQFEAYSKTIANIIVNPKIKTPLVIGIHGEWGSGKTTLMLAVERILENYKGIKGFRNCETIWFNAWKYGKEEHIFTSLVEEVLKKMRGAGFLKRFIADYYDPSQPEVMLPEFLINAFFQSATLGKLDIDMSKFEKESSFKTNLPLSYQFQVVFDKLVEKFISLKYVDSKHYDDTLGALVIFIDDLDRCLPDKTVQLLETIKIFMDRPGTIFVVGADANIIQSAIKAHYSSNKIEGIDTSEYLDKIIQVKFDLPPIRPNDMANYISNLSTVDETIKRNLQIIASSIKNPRRVKLFINHVEVIWNILINSGLAPKIDRNLLIEWLVLNDVAHGVVEHIRNIDSEKEQLSYLLKLKTLSDFHDDKDKVSAFIEKNPELVGLEKNELLIKVMKSSHLNNLTDESIGYYTYFSAAPSLSLVKEQSNEPDKKEIIPPQDALKQAYARGQNPRMLNIQTEGINLSEGKFPKANFMDCLFSHANFNHAELPLSNFTNSDLQNASFNESNLQESIFQKAILKGASFENANMWKSILRDANLEGANLRNAELSEADLTGANLKDTILQGADLKGAILVGTTIDFQSSDVIFAKNPLDAKWSSEAFEQLKRVIKSKDNSS